MKLFISKKILFLTMMIKIQDICTQLIELIGEETLYNELEGILRKHQGIARRIRKPGRVDQCLVALQHQIEIGKDITPRYIATMIPPYNLSQASLYRLVNLLRSQGVQVRAIDILIEKQRMKAGVY